MNTLNLVIGPTGSGKTFGLFNALEERHKSITEAFEKVICVGQTLQSRDNVQFYNKAFLRRIFNNAQDVRMITATALTGATISKIMNIIFENLRNVHSELNEMENFDEDDLVIYPNYSPGFQTCLILDDIDFFDNTKEGASLRPFIGRAMHHYNITLFFLKQSFAGRFRNYLFDQAFSVIVPLYRVPPVKIVYEALLQVRIVGRKDLASVRSAVEDAFSKADGRMLILKLREMDTTSIYKALYFF